MILEIGAMQTFIERKFSLNIAYFTQKMKDTEFFVLETSFSMVPIGS